MRQVRFVNVIVRNQTYTLGARRRSRSTALCPSMLGWYKAGQRMTVKWKSCNYERWPEMGKSGIAALKLRLDNIEEVCIAPSLYPEI